MSNSSSTAFTEVLTIKCIPLARRRSVGVAHARSGLGVACVKSAHRTAQERQNSNTPQALISGAGALGIMIHVGTKVHPILAVPPEDRPSPHHQPERRVPNPVTRTNLTESRLTSVPCICRIRSDFPLCLHSGLVKLATTRFIGSCIGTGNKPSQAGRTPRNVVDP